MIKAGRHSYIHLPRLHAGVRIEFEFTVNYTWYQTAIPSGINKICGFSNGLHHSNSARLGWQCENGRINLYWYVYNNGVRKTGYMGSVTAGVHRCTIERGIDNYIFTLAGVTWLAPATGRGTGYVLFPYVGGQGTFKEDWKPNLNITKKVV